MKRILIFFLLIPFVSFAQSRYYTKTGTVTFTAGTPLEDIDAVNRSVVSVTDISTGEIEFAVLIKGFEFRRGLMQEHFNENYMESDKLPKASFKGRIQEPDKINFKKDGDYPVKVKGTIEIHGKKKEIEANGLLKVAGENLSTEANFEVQLDDFAIKIPAAVKDKISPVVKVKVQCNYKPLR